MKHIIFFLCIFFSFLGTSVASFDSTDPKLIENFKVFEKKQGINNLYVAEEYIVNPFSNATINKNITVCTGNNCSCGNSGCSRLTGYTVNGKIFNKNHPLYISSGDIRRPWYDYEDGIESRVKYIKDSYQILNGILTPVQEVFVRRDYIVEYKHDTTEPTCYDPVYYDDEELTEAFTYDGSWLNEPKYFTMACYDGETDCYCAENDISCVENPDGTVVSKPDLLGHKTKPTVSFINKVNLRNVSCQPSGDFQEVLYDTQQPEISIFLGGEDLDLNVQNYREYETASGKLLDGKETLGIESFFITKETNQVADNTDIVLDIRDGFLNGTVNGISGLKSYDFTIQRLTDRSFRNIPKESLGSCARSDIYTEEYNTNGDIEIADTRKINIECEELKTAGKYNFIITAHDWAGNEVTIRSTVNIYPNVVSIGNSFLDSLTGEHVYANNIDTYDYTLYLRDKYNNPIFNKTISAPFHSEELYNGGKEILLNNGKTAFRYNYINPIETNIEGAYSFSLKGLQPGIFTERFNFEIQSWDDEYIQNGSFESIFLTNNSEKTFLKPFSASISINDGITPQLGTEHDYNIDVNNVGNITNISNSSLDISFDTLKFSSGHRFSNISNIDNSFSLNNLQCGFSGIFNALSENSVLDSPVIDIDNMNISYVLEGNQITYPLDSFGISGCDVSTTGLKTIGTTQGDGKGEITGSQGNFSDVSLSLLRSQIRENAYIAIRGLDSGDIVNGVKYVEGDTNISGNPSYETLIVKNGNVFISGDLNVSENKLGIIVLKDEGYNILSDYDKQGNIYIGNTVETINAQLYADGALRSASQNGIEYTDNLLGKKLKMKGSLFTRNTIGGGILAGGDYLLPGGVTTTNKDLAFTYDLNYIRRAQVCGEVDDYSFLIEYDPTIQLDPPKGFEVNES